MFEGIRLRSTFTNEDSSATSDVASCDYYAHVLLAYKDDVLRATIEVGCGLRDSAIADIIKISFYKEVQIHGEVSLSEHVAALVVHPDHRVKQKRLQMFAEKNSFELQWMDKDMVKSRRGLAVCGQPKLKSPSACPRQAELDRLSFCLSTGIPILEGNFQYNSLEVVWEEPQSSTPWTYTKVSLRQVGSYVWHSVDAENDKLTSYGDTYYPYKAPIKACIVKGLTLGKYEARISAKNMAGKWGDWGRVSSVPATCMLPGGYKVGDTVYSLVSRTHSKDANKNIIYGSKGEVTGYANEPNQGIKVEVRFESGWLIEVGIESITKTVTPVRRPVPPVRRPVTSVAALARP